MTEIKYTSHDESRQCYLGTLVDFHTKLGEESFWANTHEQGVMLQALIQDYFRTNHGEHLEEDHISLLSAIDEYRRRESYLVLHPPKREGRINENSSSSEW